MIEQGFEYIPYVYDSASTPAYVDPLDSMDPVERAKLEGYGLQTFAVFCQVGSGRVAVGFPAVMLLGH